MNNACIPGKRGRPKKYSTEEERKEASRKYVRKSLQKKREQECGATSVTENPSRSTPTVDPKTSKSLLRGNESFQNKNTLSPMHSSFQLQPSYGRPGPTSSRFTAPSDPLRPPLVSYDNHELPIGKKPSNPAVNTNASGYASWRPEGHLREPVITHRTAAISGTRDHSRAMVHHDTIPHHNRLVNPNYHNTHAIQRSPREEHRASASTASRSSLEIGGVPRNLGYSQGKGRKRPISEDNSEPERLRKVAREGPRQVQRQAREQPQHAFDRHVRFVSDWLQVKSYGRRHTFSTDGQAIYVKKIRPRILQIHQSAASINATFAVQYVALMALTHILRLIYVHRGRTVDGEIFRYYKADAKLHEVDDVTFSMLHIIETTMDVSDLRWLEKQQGAAGVLLQEILEVWPMVCSCGPIQVQQQLGRVLRKGFRCQPPPTSR